MSLIEVLGEICKNLECDIGDITDLILVDNEE